MFNPFVTLHNLFAPSDDPGDYLPFDPPYVDDPDWLIGQPVVYHLDTYIVGAWRFDRYGDLWLYLARPGCEKWRRVEDCEVVS